MQLKWFLSYINAKLTPWAQIIFSLIFIGMAVSSIGTQISAYLFISLVWALFFTSWLLSLCFKLPLNVTRSLMPSPTAGGEYLYHVTVHNTGQRPLRNVEVFQHKLPYGLYHDEDSSRQNTFIDWLEPDEKKTLTVVLRIPKRGSFILEPLLIGTNFPTGLIRSLKRVCGRDPLIVYPKRLKVNDPLMPLDPRSRVEGSGAFAVIGGSNEFLSTREYREGDRPRDIHWSSSARAGKLIVKEYIQENSAKAGLFIDTELKAYEKHASFESRIALCAGLAEDLFRKNHSIDLFLSQPQITTTHFQGNLNSFNEFLETLSAIEGRDNVDLISPLLGIEQHSSGLFILVLFLKDWDGSRARFVAALSALNIPLKIIIVRQKPPTIPVNDPSIAIYTPQQLGWTK